MTHEAKSSDTTSLREVMFVEPGWEEMSGRWFTGGYDEIGMDVSLKKLGANPVLLGVSPHAMHVGTRGQDVTIFGANLPRSVAPNTIDFGPGVSIERVVRATADSITVRVNVDSTAVVGKRDLYAAGVSLRDGAVVFNQISRIKVVPLAGLARVGGTVFPKQLQQFDAIAYYNGPDGKPDTDDDLEIGRVNANWSLEEYGVTYDDDDVKFVGDGRARRDSSRRTSTVRIRSGARTATTSATCGWWRRINRPAHRDARCERARSSSSPCRST